MHKSNTDIVIDGYSGIKCNKNVLGTTFCKNTNIQINYNKMSESKGNRNFQNGFITTYGKLYGDINMPPDTVGRQHVDVDAATTSSSSYKNNSNAQFNQPKEMVCDIYETRPTFVLSNDDIYNLGHYYNDVISIWNMIVLSNVDASSAILLNIDGLRSRFPSGRLPHSLMEASKPDEHGPFVAYYSSWFSEVVKAIDFKGKRVCYSEIYFPPRPGIGWIWTDWSRVNACSKIAPSPLYQSFNYYLRSKWIAKYGIDSMIDHHIDRSVIRIVLLIRSIKRGNDITSSSRYIVNIDELKSKLVSISNAVVIVQDFSLLSFQEQVKLSHSANIFISMHGAGTIHMFHAPIGAKDSYAVIELMPDTSVGFSTIHGSGNIARHLGLYYYRYEAKLGSTTTSGTTVDTDAIKALTMQAVHDITTTPACSNNNKDTTTPQRNYHPFAG